MINQAPWRSYLLAITSISINLAVVYTFFVSTAGNRSVAKFKFPDHFRDFHQAIASSNITIKKSSPHRSTGEIVKARQTYEHTQSRPGINLEINYLVGTRGDVATYLQEYTAINPKAIKAKAIKQLTGVGYHALLTDNNRAYLTSCISPRSPSNVTQQQFSQYRYHYDLQWQNGLEWLQGKASIRDRRCLWVLLSTPVTQNNIQADYRVLEMAWKDIYQWWREKFPGLTSPNS